jgi:hypothetical protein
MCDQKPREPNIGTKAAFVFPLFHHSPFTGANDEKSGFVLAVTPGGERARVLTRGYCRSPLRGFVLALARRFGFPRRRENESIEDWSISN